MGKRAVWPPNGKVKVETLSQSLHADGWLELGELPEWEVFDVAEKYHAEYHDRITRLLERERPRWFEDVDEHRNVRPGQVVARELSRRFEPKGLHISAVHPSVSDDESLDYPATGPRFYVSVIPAAMRRGPAPPPPDDVSDPRRDGVGRFHHFIWKPDRATSCTTQVVTSAFTNGRTRDWMWKCMRRVASPVVVLDSEMCHCGGPTGPGSWTASCTVQLCSSTGWKPLQSRASKSLLEYTLPINFKFAGSWIELPIESQLKPRIPDDEALKKLISQGGQSDWLVGSPVEAEFDNAWFPAIVGKRGSDGSYSVHWDGEATFTGAMPLASIRARRWHLGADVEAKWQGKWYPAKVMRVRPDGSYRVHWDGDDSCTHHIMHHQIRSRSSSVYSPSLIKRKRAERHTDEATVDDPSSPEPRTKHPRQ